jgi:hypothetical protein
VGERCVDAVAEVLRGVDQRAVEVEDQKLERFDRERPEHLNHVFSLTGTRAQKLGWSPCPVLLTEVVVAVGGGLKKGKKTGEALPA